MNTLLEDLLKTFQDAAKLAYPSVSEAELLPLIEVTPSTQEKFGHYQCNAAMKLAKPLRSAPRQIAQSLVDALDDTMRAECGIATLELAGAGFVNITLAPEFLARQLHSVLADPHLGVAVPETPERVIIDFSSPNIAKEMHVGHLRSTIIGDCLSRLFEFLGQDVLRLNHLGDWGTQFGMLIAYMKEEAPVALADSSTAKLGDLVAWYRASKQRFDTDADFKSRAQEEVVALQGGDPDSLSAWKKICAVSEVAYQEVYDLLDVRIQDRGESYYNSMLPGVVEDLEARGLVEVSEGAKCLFLDGFTNRDGDPLPLIIQKSDGGYNYSTTDLASIRNRIDDEKGKRLIYVTDAGQAQHFEMIFAAAEKAGYLDRSKVRVDHVPFGLVLGPDGKKFRTRDGETEKLIDLLNAAIAKAKEILVEREMEMTGDELDSLAKALGIGAVKYADLSCNRTGDYAFSYDKMLRFEGNTAAFLMYSYVRIAGIKRRVDVDVEGLIDAGHPINLQHASEQSLALHVLQFAEALNKVAEDLLPNRLTDYLYDLAQKFNAFFRDCRVEGSEQQSSRLLLCEAAARTLHQGFKILGLTPVDRM